MDNDSCNYIILYIQMKKEINTSVPCSLKNHEFFEQKAFRQNRVPKSLERIQATVTLNIWHISQLLRDDRVSSV